VSESRFNLALAKFDALNARDPHGKELIYAQRMTDWLTKLQPRASEALKLAAHAQHLMRWEIPRDSYPKDRPGYLKWRTTLYQFHADRAAEVLREVGYDDATVARVGELIRKEKIKSDPEVQALEDVICLVFLENYFEDFSHEHDETKLIRILQRTWKKMSPRGHDAAMTIHFSPSQLALIRKALSSGGGSTE
jgi:hypothetical protein